MKKLKNIKAVSSTTLRIFKIHHLLCFVFLFSGALNAQNLLSGTVTDETNQPLPGANVIVKGTSNGTTTDFDGNYSLALSTNSDAVLIVSYVGYLTQEQAVGNQQTINFQLVPDATTLDEVVVVGYGSQLKSDVSTAVGSVKGEALGDEHTTSFTQALTGKLAGVQIRQTSGAPGGNTSIKIRGTSTISAGSNPLYVIDGVPISSDAGRYNSIEDSRNGFQEQPTDPLASLNMDDIESIDILKDASSAAIYGSRGSNGVVIITTKKGKSGVPQVSFSTNTGFSTVLNKIDLMDAYEFANLHYDAKNNAYLDNIPGADINDDNDTRVSKGGGAYQIPSELYPYLDGEEGLINTDWQDEIFRTAVTQDYNLSVSGGNEKSNYYTSLNYLNQEGIVIGSGFERFSGRFNFEGDLSKKIKYGVNINPSRLNYDLVSSNGPTWNEGVIASALTQGPIFPVKNEDGSYNSGLLDWTFTGRGLSNQFVANPVAIAELNQDRMQVTKIISSGFLSYDILPELTYKLSYGIETNDSRRDFYRPQELETLFWLRFGPDAVSASTNTTNWLIENAITYKKSFDDHNFNLLANYSAQKEKLKFTEVTGQGYSNDLVPTINAATNRDGETRAEEWSLISYLFRAQYNFARKYFVTAAIRRDGSSRFGSENQWGNFPSASVGWRLSEEKWLENSKSINELKLRASYGVTGNYQIPNYASVALVAPSNYVTGDEDIESGIVQISPANEELGWETTETVNIGLNATLLNGMITFEADVYNSNTSDLLLNVGVPQTSGYPTQLQNIGEVNNKGFEFTVGFNKDYEELQWNSSLNFAINENEVIELGPSGDPIYASGGRGDQMFITQIGKPIGSYYGYVVDGIYNTQEEIDAYLTANSGTTQPGDFKFRDLNNDGKITVDDRQIIGDYQPDFTYGFTTSLAYKDFDFNFALQGVHGNQVLNALRHYTAIPQGGMNNLAVNVDRWESPSSPGNGTTPRANYQMTGDNTEISTYHVEDGSYLKIQNITLGYSFPREGIEKIGLQNLRLSLSAQNPFIFTDYSGYNPEVSSNPTSELAQGEDFGTYPLSKTYSLAVNVKF